MPLEPGSRLGPYEIRALLGVGGMGEVYRGRDTRLGRDVALKVISPRLVGNESSRHRFEREARAASALNHPSIVTVYDVGDTDGVSWIAMEWVDGRTLRQVFAGGPLPIEDAWSIARQIADGLAVAHARGVIHRDLKPENVMIASDGRVRILDFGLARQSLPEGLDGSLADETMSAFGATVDGVILGTVGYMSPEQASGGTVDFRSDQFSFGLLAYEMLAGQRAFVRANAIETLWATIREDPVPLTSIRSGIPAGMDRVITRCLSKKPEDRFASTRDLAAALEVTGPGLATPAPPPALPLPSEASAAAPRYAAWLRRSAIVVGGAVVLALAVVSWKGFTARPAAVHSLAVLPFENKSTDPDSNYLGDELTESLINQMSRVPSLTVMARATVFRFKGTDPRKAGQDLRVGAVLTGSIARRGNDLTILAELFDPATGERLGGGTYDGPFTDLLRLQDTIVSEISDKLRLRLSGVEKRALGGQGTDNPEAYELYLRARHHMVNGTEEDDLEARTLFLNAVEKDPRFIDAHLGIASIHIRQAGDGYAPPRAAWAKADEHLQKVRSLDPDNFGIRANLTVRRFLLEWDWPAAERGFRELSADPRVFLGNKYHPATLFFLARGWTDQAVDLLERALRVDPGNLESRVMLGDSLYHAGRLDEAMAYYRAIIQIAPDDARPLFGLAEALKRKGDIPGAISTLRQAYELSGENEAARALAAARTEQEYETAQVIVAKARLLSLGEVARDRYVSPLDFARLHAQIGERDKAFHYLTLALEERSPMVVLLKVDPAWDRIRDDTRFAAAVRRVGIP